MPIAILRLYSQTAKFTASRRQEMIEHLHTAGFHTLLNIEDFSTPLQHQL